MLNLFMLKIKRHALSLYVITGLSLFGVTGCQSTPSDPFENSAYTANTQASADRKRSPEEIAKIRTSLAGQYIRQKKLDLAMRQLEMAFKADRRYAPAHDMMGVLLQQEGSAINLKKAEKHFKKAIKLDSDFIQARNNYGVYLSKLKRYDEAIEQFRIAGAALGYDGRVSALENLGRIYLKLGKKSHATQVFLRALDTNPNSIIAHIELTDLLIEKNRIKQARDLFEETKVLLGRNSLSPRILIQGIKIAAASEDVVERQALSEQLLSAYPLSKESKQLKKWLSNPEAPWK